MSMKHNYYRLTCAGCGHAGAMHRWSDGPGLWDATITGFDETRVSADGPVFGKCPLCGARDAIETEFSRSE